MSSSVQQLAERIRSATDLRPQVGVVLGSGLGDFAARLRNPFRLPYREIEGFPVSTAIGHKGELVIGSVGKKGNETAVAALSGRFHLYEGYSAQQVVSGVRLLQALGVKKLVLTCAAGGLDPAFGEGALVLISDHINLQGANPLVGPNDETLGPRFPDMTHAYSPRLRELARQVAAQRGIALHEGVYAGLLGPNYETPAEIRFLKVIGADLVGMSTVPEAIAGNHLGMEVLGIACVTNLAAGLGPHKLVHEEVLEITRRVAASFNSLLADLLPRLSSL